MKMRDVFFYKPIEARSDGSDARRDALVVQPASGGVYETWLDALAQVRFMTNPNQQAAWPLLYDVVRRCIEEMDLGRIDRNSDHVS